MAPRHPRSAFCRTVGGTPLVELTRLAPAPGRAPVREARVVQPDRLDQGPRGVLHARRRRRGAASCGRAPHPRAVERQHRHRARDAGPPARLRGDDRDAGRVDARARAADAPVRGRRHLLAGRAGLERRGDAGPRARRRRPDALHAVPVRQPREPARARARHRGGDPAGVPRGRRLRRRARHRRHADGLRPPPAPRPARRADRGRGAAARRGHRRACARSRTATRPRSSTSRCSTASCSSATRTPCAACARSRARKVSSPASPRAASLHAAMRVARELDGPANIVMVLADGGWKYLSAGLWDTPEERACSSAWSRASGGDRAAARAGRRDDRPCALGAPERGLRHLRRDARGRAANVPSGAQRGREPVSLQRRRRRTCSSIALAIDEADDEVAAIYHSHTMSPAEPVAHRHGARDLARGAPT